ncbi:MAG: P-loop NTPase [Nitrospirae bacterium]|nr:P-loop NTPase [Nitrospirota bacterium]
MSGDLKTILKNIRFADDAKIASQIHEQTSAVHARMAGIKRKILVMSGKGGVGKSTVTAHLATALAALGNRVGVLDVDFNGPCLPKLLGLNGRSLAFRADGATPIEGPLGMKIASLDFLLKHGSPTRWNGPMELSPVWLGTLEYTVLRELLADILWGELDWWLADLPPGAAADKPPALMSFIPDLDGAVMVTTPSAIALDVVRRSVAYARDSGIRPLGLVVNMAGKTCSHCGHVENIFEGGNLSAERLENIAGELGIPLLAAVPFDPAVGAGPEHGKIPAPFSEIAAKLAGLLEGSQAS